MNQADHFPRRRPLRQSISSLIEPIRSVDGIALRRLTRASAWAALWLVAVSATAQAADAETQAPVPRTYALVGAVGRQLSVVSEGISTGSHIEPFSRRSAQMPEGLLNRLVVRGLDQAVAKSDPTSRRELFELAGDEIDQLPPYDREEAAIAKVIAQLRDLPQRPSWYRIVVVTPAYRAAQVDGLATRMQGLGLFLQPIHGGTLGSSEGDVDLDHQAGERIHTATGAEFRSQAYVAPFSYVEVWVLDPKTMTVLDRQTEFQNHKLGEPLAMPHDALQGLSRQFLASQMNLLLDTSIARAVAKSELALKQGHVTVTDPSAVGPEGAR